MTGNQALQRPKWKEIKAQKAKMKGNQRPKGQNERESTPKRKKWKEIKAQKAKMKGNRSPKGQKIKKWFAALLCKNAIFRGGPGNLWEKAPLANLQGGKMKNNESPNAKMKENEGRKGENEKNSKPKWLK